MTLYTCIIDVDIIMMWNRDLCWYDKILYRIQFEVINVTIRLSIYGYASITERLNKDYILSSQERSTQQKPNLVLISLHIHYSLNVAVEVGKP